MTKFVLSMLHLCDSFFPIGSFAYSDGLESATAGRFVEGAAGLDVWLESCLEEGFARLEGPAIAMAWPALAACDWDRVVAIDEEITALRAASTARTASRSMGLRLVKTWQRIYPHARLEQMLELARAGRFGPTLPVGFAAAGQCAGLDLRDSLAGYAYTRLASTVSAGMRLVAIGQGEAHVLLGRTLDRVPAAVDGVLERGARPESFAPAFDIAQMTQAYVHSRLFRS
jgi:urease accessory protein